MCVYEVRSTKYKYLDKDTRNIYDGLAGNVADCSRQHDSANAPSDWYRDAAAHQLACSTESWDLNVFGNHQVLLTASHRPTDQKPTSERPTSGSFGYVSRGLSLLKLDKKKTIYGVYITVWTALHYYYVMLQVDIRGLRF